MSSTLGLEALNIALGNGINDMISNKLKNDKLDNKINEDMKNMYKHLTDMNWVGNFPMNRDSYINGLWGTSEEYDKYIAPLIEENKEFITNINLKEYNMGVINGFLLAEDMRKWLKILYSLKVKKEGIVNDNKYCFDSQEELDKTISDTKDYIYKGIKPKKQIYHYQFSNGFE